MRDILIATIVLSALPFALVKPWIGVLLWTWISVMNPHKLAYGFAFDFPFALIVALVTMTGVLVTRDDRRLPLTPVTIALLGFIGWMCLTSIFAIYPEYIGEMLSKVMKIQLMTFVALLVLKTRRHIELFIWIIALSLGFYGVKGGIFTITTGGAHQVLGPPGGFISGNNELALALTMTIPLMYYLRTVAANVWIRHGLIGAMTLTALAILGSQSRGALIGIISMVLLLWLRGEKKLVPGMFLVVAGALMVTFMPSTWDQRMASIGEYQDDGSAMGRVNAWQMAFNLAKDHFLGGGFEVITKELFARYAPNPLDVHAAHSIYFQVLGEHGFVGLTLFLLVWFLTWRAAAVTYRDGRRFEDMRWASNLGAMIQVSLVGYLAGGAFLSLAYFDLPYDLLIIAVLTHRILQQRIMEGRAPDGIAVGTSVAAAARSSSA